MGASGEKVPQVNGVSAVRSGIEEGGPDVGKHLSEAWCLNPANLKEETIVSGRRAPLFGIKNQGGVIRSNPGLHFER